MGTTPTDPLAIETTGEEPEAMTGPSAPGIRTRVWI